MAITPSKSRLGRQQAEGVPVQTASASPYVDSDYEGKSAGSSILVSDGKLVRLPDQPCRYAMLAHWNVLDNSGFPLRPVSGDSMYENAGSEIYYGFSKVLVAQLFPSQSTQLLPVYNLNQICVRTRPGTSATLFYAWFW